MKTIPLTRGLFAMVDDEDFEYLNQFSWQAIPSKQGNFYARRCIRGIPRTIHIRMHREILNAPRKFQVDHKNGKGWDNQKANLRLCNGTQNSANRKVGAVKTAKSQFKGVCLSGDKNRKKKWWCGIRSNNKFYYLGRFFTEIEAAQAYNKAALKLNGEFARLNPV